MKKFLILFTITFISLSFNAHAKGRKSDNQKLVCHMDRSFVNSSYKTTALAGKEIILPIYESTLFLDTCPSIIAIEDKNSETKKHTLWLSAFDTKTCSYGKESGLICVFSYIEK